MLKHLLPLAEAEEGLKLFIDDRDGTSMTKTELFISSFGKSDKLIVCITPEFLNDESCMQNINLALASKKPLFISMSLFSAQKNMEFRVSSCAI